MNLEYKITEEELNKINNKQLLEVEKTAKLYWLKLIEFLAKGVAGRWEFKITKWF